ncbi:MAG TPA: prepilin peptidase [Brevundimonas sp.]|jgi:leader peptidase (prepilin peptidase)/N-methyltransferase|uniref:prepilin peptidase n=1 Tax=Brevundimonas sp. TaxID=1871086 RepID=UPI002DE7C199|nr:prepilin peptidase [Brevundimonas sp.]
MLPFPALDPAVVAALLGGLGLVVGSFLALVSIRLPEGEGVVAGRSRCRACAAPIRPHHLVPVISWLTLRGRCADCRAPISARHPLIELAAAGVGIWAALVAPDPLLALVGAVLGWQLLLIAVIDAERFQMFDVLLIPLIVTGLVQGALSGWDVAVLRLLGAVLGFGLLWGIGFVYARVRGRTGLGDGDPILFAGSGAWVGAAGLPSVLLWAAVAGLSVVAARLLLRKAVRGDDRLPFGVFLAVGTWLVWLYGPIGL